MPRLALAKPTIDQSEMIRRRGRCLELRLRLITHVRVRRDRPGFFHHLAPVGLVRRVLTSTVVLINGVDAGQAVPAPRIHDTILCVSMHGLALS